MNHQATHVALKFHRLTEIAIRNGGLWCISGKNTEKSVAKIIAANTDIPYRDVISALTITRPNWLDEIQFRMKRTLLVYHHPHDPLRYRFHIEAIARASTH